MAFSVNLNVRGDPARNRRLAEILAADVAGYSRLMGAVEEATIERLKRPKLESGSCGATAGVGLIYI